LSTDPQTEQDRDRTSMETPQADESVMEPSAVMPAPFGLAAVGGFAALFALVALLSKGVSFALLPVYTRYLTPAEYGQIELIELSFDVLTMIAGSRLLGGLFRFYYKSDNEDERRAIISTGSLIICGGYAVVGLAAFIGAPQLAHLCLGDTKYAPLVRIGSLALASQALGTVPLALLRLQARFHIAVAIQVVRLAVQVALNVLFLVHFHLGPRAIFLSTLVANVAVGGTTMVICMLPVGLRYSRAIVVELYRFGFPLIVMQAATFILTFGDRYFLRPATSLTTVGLYAMAYNFAFAFGVLTQTPFNLVWEPKRFEAAARPDRDAIYARVFVYFNVAALVGALAIAVFVRDFLHIIATPPFYGAADVVPVLLISIILGGWASQHEVGILVAERTGFLAAANWLAAGMTLVAYAVLIPRYGSWGAAIATVIGYMVRELATYKFSQHVLPVRYTWAPVWKLVGMTIVTYGLSRLIPSGPMIYMLPARGALYLVYLYVVWRSSVLSDADRTAAREMAGDLIDRAATVLGMRALAQVPAPERGTDVGG
jgi:O-antigen/teichoic acid export membrane protein